jgi:hypothetical protein
MWIDKVKHQPGTGLLVPIVIGAVVVLGIIIGAISMMMAKRRRATAGLWIRGAYCIWTGGEDSASWPSDRAKKSLASWYNAQNVGTFWNVIKDLKAGTTGNVAWDRIRALDILRIGMAAGYIDADQCQSEGTTIGAELQKKYGSWEELAQAFEAGMHAWQRGSGNTDPNALGRVQKNLPALRGEIWPKAPWNAPLDPTD